MVYEENRFDESQPSKGSPGELSRLIAIICKASFIWTRVLQRQQKIFILINGALKLLFFDLAFRIFYLLHKMHEMKISPLLQHLPTKGWNAMRILRIFSAEGTELLNMRLLFVQVGSRLSDQ